MSGKIIVVSSLPHHYLLDEACQTLEGMPKIQVKFDLLYLANFHI